MHNIYIQRSNFSTYFKQPKFKKSIYKLINLTVSSVKQWSTLGFLWILRRTKWNYKPQAKTSYGSLFLQVCKTIIFPKIKRRGVTVRFRKVSFLSFDELWWRVPSFYLYTPIKTLSFWSWLWNNLFFGWNFWVFFFQLI